jgi:hypothetical protein
MNTPQKPHKQKKEDARAKALRENLLRRKEQQKQKQKD